MKDSLSKEGKIENGVFIIRRIEGLKDPFIMRIPEDEWVMYQNKQYYLKQICLVLVKGESYG